MKKHGACCSTGIVNVPGSTSDVDESESDPGVWTVWPSRSDGEETVDEEETR